MQSDTNPVGTGQVVLLVGTRKGVFLLHAEPARSRWSLDGPHFLGHIAHHVVLDPREALEATGTYTGFDIVA